jgi:large subunit ribosomal protein L29
VTRVRELRDLGDEELVERLESSKDELFNLRFQLATGQLDNPMRIKDVRHDVARILTILSERAMGRGPEQYEIAAPDEAAEEDSSGEAVVPGRGLMRRGRLRKKEER